MPKKRAWQTVESELLSDKNPPKAQPAYSLNVDIPQRYITTAIRISSLGDVPLYGCSTSQDRQLSQRYLGDLNLPKATQPWQIRIGSPTTGWTPFWFCLLDSLQCKKNYVLHFKNWISYFSLFLVQKKDRKSTFLIKISRISSLCKHLLCCSFQNFF